MSLFPDLDKDAEAAALLSELRRGYAEQLMDNPPVNSTNPALVGEEQAERSATRYAHRDIARMMVAAKRKGIVVQLTREVKP